MSEYSLLTGLTPATEDGGDTGDVVLGMRFRADIHGSAAGVRFYKAAANTGTHTGHLWTTGGTMLASVTFAGETATGWQSAYFATPVALVPGAEYIISYRAPVGHYSLTGAFFNSQYDAPPLRGVSNAVAANGVFGYQSGETTFPTGQFNASNYFVDVIFRPATRVNLVPNPSAEVDTSGWSVSGGSLTRDTTVSHSGGASFKLVGVGANIMDGPTGTGGVPVTPGVAYRASFWAKGSNNADQATFTLSWYDAAGAFISAPSPTYTAMNSTAWVLIAPLGAGAGFYVAPANAAYAQLRPRTNASSTTFWVDDILFEVAPPGSQSPVYFDGDTADTADETFAWTGTPHASASTAVYTGRTNLLQNPSWEIDSTGWTSASRAPTNPNYGAWSSSMSNGALSAKLPSGPGRTYTASGYMTRNGSGARAANATVRFYDSAGAELDPPTVTLITLVDIGIPERRSATRTAPAGTATVAWSGASDGVVGLDGALLEESATLGDYFDGTTTPPAGYYTYWTGAPHNSMSRLSVTAPPTRTNLFTHPSAEGTGITWTTVLGDALVARTTDAALFGSESYSMTSQSLSNQEIVTPTGTAGFPVLAGNWYSASAYFGRSGATSPKSTQIKFNWYTAAGAAVTSTSLSAISELSGTSLVWVRGSGVALAPTTAAYASIQLRWSSGVPAGEVHYFDGILFEQVPYVYDYFDGDSVQTGYIHSWTGTPHASQSTREGGSADPTVAFKRYEAGAWVAYTAKPMAWNGTAWVLRRPKHWNGASWVDLE